VRFNGAWTRPNNGVPKIPKIRQFAQVTMNNGIVLNGHVFVDATARIQDLLNSGSQFIPFVDENDIIHLLNKNSITEVLPYDG